MRIPVHPVETAAAPPRGMAAPAGWSPYASDAAVAIAQLFLQSGSDAGATTATARTDVAARSRAMSWVARLPTRTGTDRGERIRYCGWAEVCFRPGKGQVGWRHRYCKDRACPVCARNRAAKTRKQLRAHLVAREKAGCGELVFLTLTQPKLANDREGPGEAISRLLASWRKLRDRRPFRRSVAGYVRAVECVWSRRGWKVQKDGRQFYTRQTGWHAHLHIVLELEPVDQHTQWRGVETWITGAWCEIAGGSEKGIDWQPLSRAKIGQIAKYITKPFELPAQQASIFFQDLAGRRLLQGGGTWRYYQRADDEGGKAPAGWVPQGLHVADLIDRLTRCKTGGEPETVIFTWVVDGDGDIRSGVYKSARECEVGCSVEMTALHAVQLLYADARPIAERGKDEQNE